MTWRLVIQTKNTGEHLVDFPTEEEARDALRRAHAAIESTTGELTMIEDKIAVPPSEVLSISVHEKRDRGPLIA